MIFAYLREVHGHVTFTPHHWIYFSLGSKAFWAQPLFVDVQEDLQFSSKHYKSIRVNKKQSGSDANSLWWRKQYC